MQPPKYYEKRFAKLSAFGEEVLNEIKARRRAVGEKKRSDGTDDRLEVRKIVSEARAALSQRSIE